MARWQEDTRGRLQRAAVTLFAAHGYAATTTEQIAGAAGVTQRTLFRHFRDKEEVLFAEDDTLLEALVQGARAAPEGAAPVVVLGAALGSLADRLQDGRDDQRTRAEVVASDPALVGRDLAKQARWVEAVADVLAARGLPAARARALAGAGAAAFRAAYHGWLHGSARPGLRRRVEDALGALAEDLAG
ncbi:transcriptional regulator, TetR family [Geodermatophilus pulveris]|uniref:Transcriptional regulator, TetR family n=1 Tax=Geodermatophilus pulveris TaxID=1564159 RepID=A0A239GC67_9ACTN|nr:TetR/AcrR family transcriptional regulator [Geodermatophilus pulveris]SNS66661.1 transcriptional regulator, TetR family [Geodermatophilus pulveris]